MIFNHARFQVWNAAQHPYRHSTDEFLYSHPALPGVTSVPTALDYIAAVLYPRTKPAVANVASLPAIGNTINDYRVVLDDGDGKAASYRWQKLEGEASPSWHKIYDMDWGEGSILSAFLLKTQDIYVYRYGYDDLDDTGTPIAGLLAGQQIYGGASAGTNLTLFANSGDGVGPNTGYVQFGDNVRPITDSAYSIGTTAERFLKGWFDELQSGTLNLTGGSITDSSGAISFGDETLTTTTTVTAGTLTLGAGSITDSSGAISFGNENLTTTGDFSSNKVTATGAASTFKTGTKIADITLTNGNIASDSATLNFNALNLTTTGLGTFGELTIDNVRIENNQIFINLLNGDLTLYANGTGKVKLQSNVEVVSKNLTVTSGTLAVTDGNLTIGNGNIQVSGIGALISVDNLRLDGNTISTTNLNGDLIIAPNGTGAVSSAPIYPTSASSDLGKSGSLWDDLWFGGALKDGTNTFTVTDLMTLRNSVYRDAGRTLPAQAGDTIFWSGTQWLASAPDTEIDHGSVSGLADDDHTQYALLAGRNGGQTLYGDTAASGNLTLHSTAHATKGSIIAYGVTKAGADNTYDLGASGARWKDFYLSGQAIGMRLENATTGTPPSASASTKGRLYYATDTEDVYLDVGGSWRKISVEKYELTDSSNWEGTATSVVYTVSSTVSDARKCFWAIYDNANNFEQVDAVITKTATQITVSVATPLPSGSYTIVGIG